LLEESKTRFHPKTKALVDLGYLGLQNSHANTEMPKKIQQEKSADKGGQSQKPRTLQQARLVRKCYRRDQTVQNPRG
jgi:hypothetical protein